MPGSVDADPARRDLGTLRNRNLEHAVLAGRLDAVRIGDVRQREATVEQTMRALDARQLAVLLANLGLALALDRENALLHRHFNVLRIDAGNVSEDDEAVVLFLDVDARRPLARNDLRRVGLVGIEEPIEHVPDLVLEIAAVGLPRAVTGNGHKNPLRKRCAASLPLVQAGVDSGPAFKGIFCGRPPALRAG